MAQDYPTIEEVKASRKRVKVMGWVSRTLKERVDELIAPYGGTMSGLIRNLLEEWVKEQEQQQAT
jgi:hypothetical protein